MAFRLCAAVLLLCHFAGVVAHAQTPSVAEQYLFQQVNAERAQRGISALRWDSALYRAALPHAQEMAERTSISHQFPGELELTERAKAAGVHFSLIAENVAEASTAVRVHDAWMASPGHRANILDPHVDAIGISVVQRDGQLYAVQDFGRTVETLSFEAQEQIVARLITAAGAVTITPNSEDARKTCAVDTGFAGGRQPSFLVHYTSADLSQLPDTLKARVATGHYREAAVGACPAPGGQAFSTYRIAVLLYQ